MAYIWEDSSLLSSYQDWKYAKKTSKIISFLFHIILWQLKKIDTAWKVVLTNTHFMKIEKF